MEWLLLGAAPGAQWPPGRRAGTPDPHPQAARAVPRSSGLPEGVLPPRGWDSDAKDIAGGATLK
jgi:hypothetical protein